MCHLNVKNYVKGLEFFEKPKKKLSNENNMNIYIGA